jgi:hypothetical protein
MAAHVEQLCCRGAPERLNTHACLPARSSLFPVRGTVKQVKVHDFMVREKAVLRGRSTACCARIVVCNGAPVPACAPSTGRTMQHRTLLADVVAALPGAADVFGHRHHQAWPEAEPGAWAQR